MASTNLFGAPASTSAAPASTNLFGAPVISGSAATGLFGKKLAEKLDSSAYTVDSLIGELDRAQFMAPKFTLGLIPEIPPSKEMCV